MKTPRKFFERPINRGRYGQNFINPLNRNPRRSFSQTDEDGITVNIIERLALSSDSSFLEIGVGNGLENNTLILATLGWSGIWIGNEDLDPDLHLPNDVLFKKQHIDKGDIELSLLDSLSDDSQKIPELVSVDIDSIDYYIVEEMLRNQIKPKIFIVEYNGTFIPPIKYVVNYESNLSWKLDSKYGASLTAWVNLFETHDYRLVACSISGINAFFVSNSVSGFFKDIPNDINEIYKSPNYFAQPNRGWDMSIDSINLLLKRD